MFKSWCSKNDLKNAKATSHVLMDGGVLSIPFDKLDEFCERYVEAVKNKEKLYLVEQIVAVMIHLDLEQLQLQVARRYKLTIVVTVHLQTL